MKQLIVAVSVWACVSTAVWAQGLDGGPPMSRYARDLLEREGMDVPGAPAEPAATSRAGDSSVAASAPRRAGRFDRPQPQNSGARRRRRRIERGLRGMLEREARGNETIENPDLDGTKAEDHGYTTVEGPLAVAGIGDDHPFSPFDVSQGSLGDCYLLAAMSSLAHTDPDVLQGMVRDNGDGTYTVRLFEPSYGFWTDFLHGTDFQTELPGTSTFRDIRVTAEFPTNQYGGVAFARGSGDAPIGQSELWPMLIEKAYAELLGDGSYEDIEGGYPTVAFNALTGAPAQLYWTDDLSVSELDFLLRAAMQAGHPISIGSKDDEDDPLIKGRHAYSVLSFKDGTYVVRNPWGFDHPRPLTAREIKQYFKRIYVGQV